MVLSAEQRFQKGQGLSRGGGPHRTSESFGSNDPGRHHQQKLPENNGGFKALNTGGSSYGKLDERIYTDLTSDHPIDLCRYQIANCYMGRSGLINSGGESKGAGDLENAVMTAVINKRAGGMGLISGRKAFQRPMKEGVALLNAVQDVYLSKEVTVV